jgi:hypothetical protein
MTLILSMFGCAIGGGRQEPCQIWGLAIGEAEIYTDCTASQEASKVAEEVGEAEDPPPDSKSHARISGGAASEAFYGFVGGIFTWVADLFAKFGIGV